MKKNKKIQFILIASSLLFPALSFAAPLGGLKALIGSLGDIIYQLQYLIYGLAILYFFWGLAGFISESGDPAKHQVGKDRMIYGIVALFVMFSVFGILNWLSGTLGIKSSTSGITPSDVNNVIRP